MSCRTSLKISGSTDFTKLDKTLLKEVLSKHAKTIDNEFELFVTGANYNAKQEYEYIEIGINYRSKSTPLIKMRIEKEDVNKLKHFINTLVFK